MPLLYYSLHIEMDINIVNIAEAIIEEMEIMRGLVSHGNQHLIGINSVKPVKYKVTMFKTALFDTIIVKNMIMTEKTV